MNFILVFIGGGLGSICRYGIAVLMKDYNTTFPWATLVANVLSCIVLGALVGYTLKNGNASDFQKFLLITGFCGGFSTFSTFSNETFVLIQNGFYYQAIANVLLSVLICLVCIFTGMKLAG